MGFVPVLVAIPPVGNPVPVTTTRKPVIGSPIKSSAKPPNPWKAQESAKSARIWMSRTSKGKGAGVRVGVAVGPVADGVSVMVGVSVGGKAVKVDV